MVIFCDDVVRKIKGAVTETELHHVIQDSITQFKTRRESGQEDVFLMNMVVTLQATKNEELPPKVVKNVNKALEIFRSYLQISRERLF